MNEMITQDRLKQLFDYDPDTGKFTWLRQVSNVVRIGSIAGNLDKDGYVVIQIGGIKYRAGRLAWLYMTGRWPASEIDHIDGVRSNDTFSNLREATRSDNIANSLRAVGISGLRGVIRDPKNPLLWRARVAIGYHREWLGPFETAEEAYEAYLTAADGFHGEFALHNRNSDIGA